jgi:hypothetical protein
LEKSSEKEGVREGAEREGWCWTTEQGFARYLKRSELNFLSFM